MRKNDIQKKITRKEIEEWSKNETIIITAGTGAGKSYFIKNDLYKYAKENNQKILFLIHRLNCVKQFQEELDRDNKNDIIDIKTYQSIEWRELKGYDNDLSKYDYIVCDEFHYFISDADSKFNITTDLSLNKILEQKATKIFMSASAEYVTAYLKNKRKIQVREYKVDIDFDFIETLEFFYTDEQLEKLMKEYIEQGKKAIFFINNLDKATELYKKYKKRCLFNCSKDTKEYKKYVDEDKINDMLSNCRFQETILITTTCLDAGVNIIDDELKNIVIYGIRDISVIKQCLGRKRLKPNEKITVTIHAINNNQLGGEYSKLEKKRKQAQFLIDNGVEKFVEKYGRELDHSRIIYDIKDEDAKLTKAINELLYFKIDLDIKILKYLLGHYEKFTKHKHAFINSIATRFGKEFKDVRMLKKEQQNNDLTEYLEKLVGQKLYKEEQKALIDRVNYRFNGKQYKTAKKLNEAFTNENLNYLIINKKSGSMRFWVIEKIGLEN